MWITPPPPTSEGERLAELHGYEVLDTAAEERFDRITRIATHVYSADVAFLSVMDSNQQWMKSKTSHLLGDVIQRDRSLCTVVVSTGTELVIDDMRTAPELEGHPTVRQAPWRFYASVPLRGEAGHVIGTLCVMRSEPGPPAGFKIDVLRDLAAISSHELTLSRQNSELHRLTNTDALTGLANRRMFDEEFLRAWRRSRRTGEPASLLLLDLDRFKEVNDGLGHQAGDRALVDFARFLEPFGRRPDDLVARVGGEEFGFVLAGADADGAIGIADAIIRALDTAALPHPTRRLMTTSIGMATLRDDEDHSSWWRRADAALYDAKAAGRATVRVG
ncbi:diguanylate cyclase (GGDEF) domain-containing protein [Kaistia soli DSM 19436]|uniref:diguanylate cyclase n=1 Tax=Kaistia soli DSM 19436 TaxID=1122133 RepID=A0A1M5H7N6_9HYPH|nr:sensor domain-containing diguanylate cyclase [Kaistia soli]SHG11944.1 diguanylate cyclase (GGDEF) domain-containing protein [Kaistia soli DSM 19436]